MRITLSRTASAEFKGILNYTGKAWGKEQRKRYKETLWNGFRNIAAFPFIGESRPEYGESARIHRIDVYVVIYEPMENEIIISRIIHQRRAIELLLGDEFVSLVAAKSHSIDNHADSIAAPSARKARGEPTQGQSEVVARPRRRPVAA